MSGVEEIHQRAMAAAERAVIARIRGDAEYFRDLMREAFDLERQAANMVAPSADLEPTRSVLHRSAASLALEIGDHREAERLIGVALAGSPPEEILGELRSLLQDVHFHHHLAVDGIELEPNEFQYTLIGCQVGEGIAPSVEFMRRIDILDKLVYRIAERKASRPFRTQGRRDGSIQENVELFVKVPRAASFAIGFRLGHRAWLPTMDPAVDVIGDMLQCVSHFAHSEVEPLKALIPDPSYFENFVSLARRLVPDGKRVGTAGLSGRGAGMPHAILLKPKSGEAFRSAPEEKPGAGSNRVTARGTLLVADAEGKEWGKIKVVYESEEKTFRVSPSIMVDVVRPYFDSEVVVNGHQEGRYLYLDEIVSPS